MVTKFHLHASCGFRDVYGKRTLPAQLLVACHVTVVSRNASESISLSVMEFSVSFISVEKECLFTTKGITEAIFNFKYLREIGKRVYIFQ